MTKSLRVASSPGGDRLSLPNRAKNPHCWPHSAPRMKLKSAGLKPGEWNQVEIIADGNTLTHIINGQVMAVLVDTDTKFSQAERLDRSGNRRSRQRENFTP